MTLPPHDQGDTGDRHTDPVSGTPWHPPQPQVSGPPAGASGYHVPPPYPTPYAPAPPRHSGRWLFFALGMALAFALSFGGFLTWAAVNRPGEQAAIERPPTQAPLEEPPSTGEPAPSESEPDAEPSDLPGIGDEAVDGDFAFTVTEVETGVKEVGDEFFSEKAQGRFAIVHMTVENVGSSPQFFTDEDQRLFDAEGREFSASFTADLILNEDGNAFYEELNPGNRIEVHIAFDVPEDAEPASVELHGSFYSNGVLVSLR